MRRVKAFSLSLLLGLFAAVLVARCSKTLFPSVASSFMAHADPSNPSANSFGGSAGRSSAAQAGSPESPVNPPPPPDPCVDCIPGEVCSGYASPPGSDPNCLRGICDASCECKADFVDGIECKEANQKECVKTEYSCRAGKCESKDTDLTPPAPPQRCWEQAMWGQLYARRNNWGLTFPGCTWSESFSNVPKPGDTCTLNSSRDALVKMTSQFRIADCDYEAAVVDGYPKRRPADCQTCRPDTSIERCDWVRDTVVPPEPTPTPANVCPPMPAGCGLGCRPAPYPKCIECTGSCVTTPITYYTQTGECLMATHWSGDACCPQVGCDIKAHGYGNEREGDTWIKRVPIVDTCPSQRGLLLGAPVSCVTCSPCDEKLDCISDTNPQHYVFVKDGHRPMYGHEEGGVDQCWCVPKKDACPSGYHPQQAPPVIKYTPFRATGLLDGTPCLNSSPVR
jgi:hypothetical protein